MIVKPATSGVWLDCITPLSTATLSLLRVQHPEVVGIVRSTPLPANNTSGEIQLGELERIIAAGYESFWYQRVRGTPATNMLWVPSQHDGAKDAKCACDWAADPGGYPAGVSGFQDLEATNDTAANVQKYCDDWGSTCAASPYLPELYVGYSPNLTPDELHELKYPHVYWHGGGGPAVSIRDYAIKQGGTIVVNGIVFDVNAVKPDRLGGLPMVAAPDPAVS